MQSQMVSDCIRFQAFHGKKPIIVFGSETMNRIFEKHESEMTEPNVEGYENTAFGHKVFVGNFEYGYQIMAEEDYKSA